MRPPRASLLLIGASGRGSRWALPQNNEVHMSKAAKQAGHDPGPVDSVPACEHAASPEKNRGKRVPRKGTVRAGKRARDGHGRPTQTRPRSKGQAILNLLRRKNGASIAEM